jgi:p24 family protein delta-1
VNIFSEYEIVAAPGQVVDYEVKDTKQHILSRKDDISKGKFSFTSEIFDVYELCFISKVPHSEFRDYSVVNFLIHPNPF